MKPGEAGVTFCDGTVLHSSQCHAGLGYDWAAAITRLGSSLRRAPAVDLSSVASLAALALVTGITTSVIIAAFIPGIFFLGGGVNSKCSPYSITERKVRFLS